MDMILTYLQIAFEVAIVPIGILCFFINFISDFRDAQYERVTDEKDD